MPSCLMIGRPIRQRLLAVLGCVWMGCVLASFAFAASDGIPLKAPPASAMARQKATYLPPTPKFPIATQAPKFEVMYVPMSGRYKEIPGMTEYALGLQNNIMRDWKAPGSTEKKEWKATIIIDINRQGEWLNTRILDTVNVSPELTAAMMRALKSSTPFPPLPGHFSEPVLSLRYCLEQSTSVQYEVPKLRGIDPAQPQVNVPVQENPVGNVDFQPYLQHLERKIKNNWHPPQLKHNTRAVAVFKLNREGRVIALKLLNSSQDALTDQSALQAIRDAQPFKRLPKAFKGSTLDVQFIFDYEIRDKWFGT